MKQVLKEGLPLIIAAVFAIGTVLGLILSGKNGNRLCQLDLSLLRTPHDSITYLRAHRSCP